MVSPYHLKDHDDGDAYKVFGGANITLIGTVIVGCMGLACAVLLASTRNYLKPPASK